VLPIAKGAPVRGDHAAARRIVEDSGLW